MCSLSGKKILNGLRLLIEDVFSVHLKALGNCIDWYITVGELCVIIERVNEKLIVQNRWNIMS